ncbi:hypothetical protein [Halobellus marinus]|uniref:hypothetical protein n=1 Tax=Halobellus TaxID=1073986 RepID=UPI0028AA2D52|nr:hypothetical protein [Halobellus sp. DFY28]
MTTTTDLDRAEDLKERAGDEELTDSDVETLIELLDSDDEEARGVAAKALSSHSKDHAAGLREYAPEFRSRVTEPDQDSTRQSYLGETLSQIGLVAPEEVVPVAQTLFEFTMKPWRFFSFTDAVVAAAVDDDEVLNFLRSRTDSDSQPERNNAHYALSKVADEAPGRITPHLAEFVEVVDDGSEYLKIRGHAAKTYGLAAAESTTVRPEGDSLSTLLESRESTAVEGALASLAALTEHPSMDLAPGLYDERLEILAAGDDEEVSLWSDDRKRVEAIQEYLAGRTGAHTTDSGGGQAGGEETQVFDGSETTEVAPADVGGEAANGSRTTGETGAGDDRDGSSGVSFCPNCGEDLRQWSDPSFCTGCGFEFP